MNELKRNARLAGALYLLMGIVSGFGMMYVPSKMFVEGNAALTVQNITDSALLFRFGLAANLIGQVIFIFLGLSLYNVFKDVDRANARLMMSLVVAAVAVMFTNIFFEAAVLVVSSRPEYLKGFGTNTRNNLAVLFVAIYKNGVNLLGMFWGLWLYPFGRLVMKSGFIPKIIGILLMVNCGAYIVDALIFLLVPEWYTTANKVLMLPLVAGEFSSILWLLIKGVSNQRTDIPQVAG